jgi:hypothetical protein
MSLLRFARVLAGGVAMRISVLSFATGAAVGYLLGARAGRQRYEQLVKAGQVAAVAARTAYGAGRAGVEIARSTVDRIEEARERSAQRKRSDWELDAALLTVEQPFNGHARAT